VETDVSVALCGPPGERRKGVAVRVLQYFGESVVNYAARQARESRAYTGFAVAPASISKPLASSEGVSSDPRQLRRPSPGEGRPYAVRQSRL
jgi:hypothetical protein